MVKENIDKYLCYVKNEKAVYFTSATYKNIMVTEIIYNGKSIDKAGQKLPMNAADKFEDLKLIVTCQKESDTTSEEIVVQLDECIVTGGSNQESNMDENSGEEKSRETTQSPYSRVCLNKKRMSPHVICE